MRELALIGPHIEAQPMISIGCKTHPRYEAKSKRPPKGCYVCLDLWWLKKAILERTECDTTVYAEELKVTP